MRDGKIDAIKVVDEDAEAEQELVGKPATLATYQRAAQAAMHGAVAQTDNAFKIDLARRTLVRALTDLGGA